MAGIKRDVMFRSSVCLSACLTLHTAAAIKVLGRSSACGGPGVKRSEAKVTGLSSSDCKLESAASVCISIRLYVTSRLNC